MTTTMKSKLHTLFCCCLLAFSLTACYEDKGNYTYAEKPEITAEGFPELVSVIQNAESLTLTPNFTSSVEGNINNNPNFEFGCVLWKNAGLMSTGKRQIDINEEHTKNIDFFVTVDEGDYTAWYTVTDKRTGVTTNFSIPVKVTSATYEGWMVLCDDKDGYANIDLVSLLSGGRNIIVRNVLGTNAPQFKGGNNIYLDPWPKYAKGDMIWYCTQDGSYSVNPTKLTAMYNVVESEFIEEPYEEGEQIVAMDGVYMSENFAVSNKGNLYVKISWKSGTMFENAINTFTPDGKPEFKVAPFVGVSYNHPLGRGEYVALFYDKDNKQFIKWDEDADNSCCQTIEDPANKLFSFRTGMDLVTMKNTKFSGGVVYSVLQDAAGQRYVYGINLSGGSFEQTYCKQVSAPGFGTATQFAFHSQYPYMFYNQGDKVNAYQLVSETVNTPLTLPGEEITLLKFNTFMRPASDLSDQSDAFLEQQYYLIVGSYKTTDDGKGGTLRFYKFTQATGELSLVKEYTGFGRIKDVVYRER